MRTIGVGLIGTGFMGKCHALAWNAVEPVFGDMPDICLVHVSEANEQIARRARCRIATVYQDLWTSLDHYFLATESSVPDHD